MADRRRRSPGWLAGLIVTGFGFGLIGNIVIGIVGAFIAGWPVATARYLDRLPASSAAIIKRSTIGAVHPAA